MDVVKVPASKTWEIHVSTANNQLQPPYLRWMRLGSLSIGRAKWAAEATEKRIAAGRKQGGFCAFSGGGGTQKTFESQKQQTEKKYQLTFSFFSGAQTPAHLYSMLN